MVSLSNAASVPNWLQHSHLPLTLGGAISFVVEFKEADCAAWAVQNKTSFPVPWAVRCRTLAMCLPYLCLCMCLSWLGMLVTLVLLLLPRFQEPKMYGGQGQAPSDPHVPGHVSEKKRPWKDMAPEDQDEEVEVVDEGQDEVAADEDNEVAPPPRLLPRSLVRPNSSSGASGSKAHDPVRLSPLVGLPMLVPSGNGQQVNIWCTGIEMLTGVHEEFQAHAVHEAQARFKPRTWALINQFKELLLDEEEIDMANMSSMVVVDARGPPGFKVPRDSLGHVGTHPAIMQQVLDSPQFIEDIARQLESQWPKRTMNSDKGHDIGILVFCHSGKRLSVAWAYLLQALLMSYKYRANVFPTAINFQNTCGQRTCAYCWAATPHSILNQAVVKLSLVNTCNP